MELGCVLSDSEASVESALDEWCLHMLEFESEEESEDESSDCTDE